MTREKKIFHMVTDESISRLLKNVHEVIPKSEESNGYNIFSVLEIEYKEVIMCRMLADLLNPYGQHGSGGIFLRSFMENVLHVESSVTNDIDKLQVTKEYPIDDVASGPNESNVEVANHPKRIDIVIHGAGHFIPIEVKIDANETGTQCWEYYQYALKIDSRANLYFLTKHGTYPDKSYGIFELGKCQDRCKRISFERDIVDWLESIIKFDFDDHDNIVHSIIRQYLSAIIYFTNIRRFEMVKCCAKKVMEVDIEAGVAIAKSFTAIQDNLITKLFTEIEKVFPDKLDVVLDKKDDNDWEKIGQKFFGDVFGKGQKYASKKPCTRFKIRRSNETAPEDKFLYVHIDWRIWAELRSGDITSWIYLPTGNRTATEDRVRHGDWRL